MTIFSLSPISIAPMMDYTDRHFRYFLRQITKKTLLYTEMITTQAIIHGDRHKLLDFSAEEKPLILQLGGDNPQKLAQCAKIGEDWGYDGINLNVGCPSNRVQNGNFGACLMAKPDAVAKALESMQEAVNIPVSIKHRIGIDNQDSYEDMLNFVKIVNKSGCKNFTIHARKAWLNGLSPKDNRTIPPLHYDYIHRLKQELPSLNIEINGGITTLIQIEEQLNLVDAVMIGRAAYDNPYLFAHVDQKFWGEIYPSKNRHQIIESMFDYIDFWVSKGVKLHSISRHLLQIFAGQTGTKAWKRFISENVNQNNADSQIIKNALNLIDNCS